MFYQIEKSLVTWLKNHTVDNIYQIQGNSYGIWSLMPKEKKNADNRILLEKYDILNRF